MTYEEMARLYLIEKYGLRKDLEIVRIQHTPLCLEFYTYLEGLKAGEKLGFEKGIKAKVNTTTISDCPVKPMWHSVVAGDLPSEGEVVLDENGDKVEYTEEGRWQSYSEYYEGYIEIDPPIIWCKVPKYVEV